MFYYEKSTSVMPPMRRSESKEHRWCARRIT
jgi:hypothetical protein